MRIHTIADLRDGSLRDLITSSARGKRLVPVIGAGFSCDLPALNGHVPDADSLKCRLIALLLANALVGQEEADELRGEDFSEVVMTFFDFAYPQAREDYQTEDARRLRKAFNSYIENNCTSVRGLSPHQQEFLCCGWPYLYTLNFDDAIEPCLGCDYTVIHPYVDIDRSCYDQGHKSLIKLHGDAAEMVRTHSRQPRIILDVRQYLQSITDDANAELLQWLIDDCASKDLLFIGCSLDSEQDILFAQHVGVSALSGTSSQNSVYVYYDERPDGELPHSVRRKLRRYNIKNVLRLRPEEYDEFYHLVAQICREQMSGTVESELDHYTGFTFHRLPTADTSAEHILYEPELVSYGTDAAPQVTLPSFYVERSVSREVVEALKGDEPVCTILGRRFSGMTYALLGVVDLLQREGRQVYFFTQMRLADETVDRLAEKRDCVLVFDAYTAESRQAAKLLELGADELKARRLQLVFAVDQSDTSLFEGPLSADTRLDLVSGFQLESTLDSTELAEFNQKVGMLFPVQRCENETFLDYASKVDEAIPDEETSSLPDASFLATAEESMLAAVMALALQPAMRVDTASRLGINDELTSLCESVSPVVERSYLSPLEADASEHSGTKYVSNSLYWLVKCLRNVAEMPGRTKDLADAFEALTARRDVPALPPATTAHPALDDAATPSERLEALSEILR